MEKKQYHLYEYSMVYKTDSEGIPRFTYLEGRGKKDALNKFAEKIGEGFDYKDFTKVRKLDD